MKEYRYRTVDVFTERRFGGNPLAVVTDARGLSDGQMQAIAREFNYSETTFVLPPDDPANSARVRIFTPASELPFAGHPNIGTAFVLAAQTRAAGGPVPATLRFEEQAGLVPLQIHLADDGAPTGATLTAPQPLALGVQPPVDRVAALLGIQAGDVDSRTHAPVVATVGVPFLVVQLTGLDVLRRVRVDRERLRELAPRLGDGPHHDIVCVYAEDSDPAGAPAPERSGGALRMRVFAPLAGVDEDPATGSAAATLCALRAHHDKRRDGTLNYRLRQGDDVGRPSRLDGGVDKRDGALAAVRIGGRCVDLMRGVLCVD